MIGPPVDNGSSFQLQKEGSNIYLLPKLLDFCEYSAIAALHAAVAIFGELVACYFQQGPG